MRTNAAPVRWKHPCSSVECSLHQLSPYIGKLKSTIARELIERYSRRGELVVDPFSGAGTIPFEAALRGRRAFAADISPYAAVLTVGKLRAPRAVQVALQAASAALADAQVRPRPDLRRIPRWVRQFFHPETLREALSFADVGRQRGNEFLMACFLGVLHHQRPGFLSFPSSHLVPYLRGKKYPREKYPSMYGYRALEPRLLAKIQRSYKRPPDGRPSAATFVRSSVQELQLPEGFDALITSPPYMNALDYGRDNRLRLWFINPDERWNEDNGLTRRREAFIEVMTALATKVQGGLRRGGHCVFVVGEESHRSYEGHPAEVVTSLMRVHAPSLQLRQIVTDDIPDIRRTRREFRGVKTEHVLVYQRRR